ncbi:hypothetical protein [Rheinheimera nanhaiensis]|uniref:hypothetical protein n=1 Tax=Rheinheimera nanhaiensis TaxID=1163621 RepID=UPI00058CBC73|nr:hypothetical protein [Rheinheimera nanhaiensis]
MRDRLWYYLQNSKFKAGYLCELSKTASTCGNIYSFILALGSAGSVAAWAIWNEFPYVWASIVGISQILHVAKPHIPFLKNDKEYIELCFKYEFLYLKYEKLWCRYEKGTEDENFLETEFYELRDIEVNFLNNVRHVHVPNFKRLIEKVSQEVEKELSRTFC